MFIASYRITCHKGVSSFNLCDGILASYQLWPCVFVSVRLSQVSVLLKQLG